MKGRARASSSRVYRQATSWVPGLFQHRSLLTVVLPSSSGNILLFDDDNEVVVSKQIQAARVLALSGTLRVQEPVGQFSFLFLKAFLSMGVNGSWGNRE